MAFFITLLSLPFIACIPALFFSPGLLIAFGGFWALRKEFLQETT
jgi:hypothetical protein